MTVDAKLFDEKLDPEIVKIADRYIELFNQAKETNDKLKIQGSNLMGLMKKAGHQSIKHGGKLISINHTDAKEKIDVKEEGKKSGRKKKIK